MKKRDTILVNLDERREMKRMQEAVKEQVGQQDDDLYVDPEVLLATLEKVKGALSTEYVFPTDILFKMRDEQR